MSEKVIVISNTHGAVSIDVPELRLSRTWAKKGAKIPIDFNTLQEAMYDPGVEYMFKHGLLYIEDLEVKKKLELEPEDATEPQNIIVLSDDQKERYLSRLPYNDFKIAFAKLSKEEQISLAQYAIDNKIQILKDKSDIIKESTHIDINKLMELSE